MLKYKFIVEILISRIQTSDKKLTFTNAQSILNILKKKKKKHFQNYLNSNFLAFQSKPNSNSLNKLNITKQIIPS